MDRLPRIEPQKSLEKVALRKGRAVESLSILS